MTCPDCKEIGGSFKEKPFWPPGGYNAGKKTTFQCSWCNQRWFCYNDYYCLWGKVNDDFTWRLLVNNVDSIPIQIGSVCQVLPGYEQFDVEPAHETISEKVYRPKMRLIPTRGKCEDMLCFQWVGDYEPSNIYGFQFNFPILGFPEEFLSQFDKFVIPFVGKISQWPNSEMQEGIASQFEDPEMEKVLVQIMSAEFSQDYAGGKGPVSFLSGIALLADPNVGVIKPSYFFDPMVSEWEIDEFKEKNVS